MRSIREKCNLVFRGISCSRGIYTPSPGFSPPPCSTAALWFSRAEGLSWPLACEGRSQTPGFSRNHRWADTGRSPARGFPRTQPEFAPRLGPQVKAASGGRFPRGRHGLRSRCRQLVRIQPSQQPRRSPDPARWRCRARPALPAPLPRRWPRAKLRDGVLLSAPLLGGAEGGGAGSGNVARCSQRWRDTGQGSFGGKRSGLGRSHKAGSTLAGGRHRVLPLADTRELFNRLRRPGND